VGLPARLLHPLYVLIAFLLTSLLLYSGSALRLGQLWLDDGYSHGFLLLAVCIYIFRELWQIRESPVRLQPNFSASALLLLLSIIWAAAVLTFIEKIELITYLLILPAVMAAIYGWKQAKHFWFPFFLLLFAAPVVEVFNNLFRKATAVLSGIALEISGLTVLVDGYLIQIPVGLFEVDTGCSGIRVVTVGIIMALLYIYLNREPFKRALVILCLATGFAFLSNIIRVYIIVLAGHLTNMQHSLIRDHANLGWVVFAITMVIYYYFLNKFYPPLPVTTTDKAAGAVEREVVVEQPTRSLYLGLTVCLLALASGPVLSAYVAGKGDISVAEDFGLPPQLGNMTKQEKGQGDWRPEYKFGQGDYSEQAVYSNGSLEVIVHIRVFNRQSPANEAINVNNRVYTRGVWSEVYSQQIGEYGTVNLPFVVEESEIHLGRSRKRLVWRWYETDHKKTGDERIAKLYNLWGSLKRNPAITVYMITVEPADDRELARRELHTVFQTLQTATLTKH